MKAGLGTIWVSLGKGPSIIVNISFCMLNSNEPVGIGTIWESRSTSQRPVGLGTNRISLGKSHGPVGTIWEFLGKSREPVRQAVQSFGYLLVRAGASWAWNHLEILYVGERREPVWGIIWKE